MGDGRKDPLGILTPKNKAEDDPLGIKKKEETTFPLLYKREKTSSIPAITSSKEVEKVREFVTGKPKVQETVTIGEPIVQKEIKKEERPFDLKINEKSYLDAEDRLNKIMYDEGDKWKDPVKELQKQATEAKTIEELNSLNIAAELTKNSLASDGYEANKILNDSWLKNESSENRTLGLVKDKADRYNNAVNSLRNVDIKDKWSGRSLDLTKASNDFLDYEVSPQIEKAALEYHLKNDPSFAQEYANSGMDGTRFASSNAGQKIDEFLNDENVAAYLLKENPNLLPAAERMVSTLRTRYKDYGINQVANEVSRAMQETGYNDIDPIFNFDNQTSREFANGVANAIYANDPESLEIYNKYIKDNQSDYLDRPSLFEGVASAGKTFFKGIGNTLTTPFKSDNQRTFDKWERDASYVSADPKGLTKFLRDSGHALGTFASIAGTGNILGGLGLRSSLANTSAIGIGFLGDNLEQGFEKYPDSPIKAWTSALFNTGVYMAMGQRIFPADKVKGAFAAVKPEIETVVKNLTSGSITREVARQQANNIFKKGIDLVAGTATKSVKIGAELTGATILNKMLDKVMGMDEKTFKKYHPEGEEWDTFKSMTLSNIFVGALSKYGEMRRGNKIVEESLFEAASNPKRFQRIIENANYKDQPFTKEELKSNLDYLVKVKDELSQLGVSDPKAQKRFLFESIKHKVAKEAIESTPDATMTRRSKEEIKRYEEVKEAILEGKDPDTIVTEAEQKEIDENEKSRLEVERLTKANEIDNKEFDAKRKELDGRNPDDRIKIERLEQGIKEKNEDFKNKVSKLNPEQNTEQPEVSATASTELSRGDVEVHKQNIHDKFRKEFEAKGVPKEQVDVAIALMEARAKSWASEEKGRNADDWYSKIADVKSGEFVDGSGRQFQVEAYHGSPHDFDKFSISKIGTGEGAAAFGHGLYFTDLKGIAEEYARRLSNDTPIIDGKKIDDWFRDNDLKAPYSSNYWMPELLSESKSKDEALSKIDLRIKSQEGKIDGYNDILDDGESTQNERAGARRALEILEKDLQVSYDLYNAVFRSKNFEPPSKGRNLYKVSLHEGKQPNEYNWLDWDKDLPKEKIDKIRKVLLEYDLPDGYSWATDSNKNKNHVVHQVKDAKGNIVGEGIDKEEASKDAGVGKRFYPYFGEERRLAEFDKVFKRNSDGKYTTGAGFYHRLSELLGSDKAASDLLLKAGIDGVKYPAESIARGATSDNARGFNYVVFDDKAVTIKEKVQFQNNKGAVETLSDGRKVIHALDAPDFSTMVHEIAHVFEGDLTEAESKIVKDFGGSEPFARGFEKYLRDGKAPTTELKTLFEKFKQWLTDIYKTLKGSPIEKRITPEIKQIFDRLLTEQKAPSLSSNTPSKEQLPNIKQEGGKDAISEQSAEGVFMGETPGDSSKVVEGISKPKEPTRTQEEGEVTGEKEIGGGQRPPGEYISGGDEGGISIGGITQAANAVRRQNTGLPEFKKDPQSFEQWTNEAERLLKEGYDVDGLMNRLAAGEDATPVENAIRKIYYATVDAEVAKNPTDKLLALQKRNAQIGDMVNRRAGQNLVSLKGEGSPLSSLSDFYVARMEALGVGKLTEGQKRETKELYDNVQKADAQAEAKLKIFEEENARLKAENELLKQAKEAKASKQSATKGVKKSREDFVTERKSLKEELKAARKEHQEYLKEQGIHTAGFGSFTVKEAKVISKIVKSYVDEGVTKLGEVVSKVFEEVKDIFPNITEKDIHDVIAGEYNERRPTRNELAARMRDLKDEAYYANKLGRLLSGAEPKSEKAKTKRNQEIEELKQKIKSFKKEEAEANKFYGEEASSDLKKLQAIKKRNEKEASELKERIEKGEFETKKRVPFLEDPEIQKKFPNQYKETLDAIIKREDARHEFDIAVLKDQMSKRGFTKKTIDMTGDIIGTTKALVTGIDASGIAIQNLVALISHPRSAGKALPASFTDFWSEKNQQRWLAGVHSSQFYDLSQRAELDITEPQSLSSKKREDMFTHNLLDKRIKYKGKIYIPSKYTTKPFERIFVGLGNRVRWNLWVRGVEKLFEEGYTWESHPEEFKSLAKVLNTETGRGSLHPQIEKAFNLVSAGIWSPRLMASRMNILGIGDIGNLIAGGKKGYYGGLTPRMRSYALKDLAKFITFGGLMMGLAGITFADDVDFNPNSSTFGTVLVDGKRYNFWGGFTQYVRLISKYISGGERRSDGDFVKTDPLTTSLRFLWSKTTPAVGTGISLMRKGQRDYMGEPVTIMSGLESLAVPLSIRGMAEGLKKEGGGSLIWTALPSFIGVNVSYEDRFKDNKPKQPQGGKKPKKPQKND